MQPLKLGKDNTSANQDIAKTKDDIYIYIGSYQGKDIISPSLECHVLSAYYLSTSVFNSPARP